MDVWLVLKPVYEYQRSFWYSYKVYGRISDLEIYKLHKIIELENDPLKFRWVLFAISNPHQIMQLP